MPVLVLSSPRDAHAQAVTEHLSSMGQAFTYWSVGNLLNENKLTFNLTDSGFSCLLDQADGTQSTKLSDYESVWLRRPRPVQSPPLPEAWMESAANWETTRALDAMFRILPCFWVNSPSAQFESGFKLRQLDIARQCGLAVPETLVTNDPEAARAFCEQTAGEVIYKFIDEGTGRFFPTYEAPRGIPTMPLSPADLPSLDQVQHSLHLFQRKIAKRSDLRVTIVGQKIFAVEIHSQEGKGALDFRLDYSVPMNEYSLPDSISDQCLQVMRQLNLVYGAFDLCLAEDGQYYFFEVNPAGQWLWMEISLQLPISYELARLLARK